MSSLTSVTHPVANDIARLLLRVTLGVTTLLHGIAKIVHPESLGWISEQLTAMSMPSFLAYGVFVGELIAPAFVLVGLFTRPAAAVIVVNMVFALLLAHGGDILRLNETGGWAIELQVYYVITALALVLVGGGRFGLLKGEGPLN